MLEFSSREIQRLSDISDFVVESDGAFAFHFEDGSVTKLDWFTSDLILATIQHVIAEATNE